MIDLRNTGRSEDAFRQPVQLYERISWMIGQMVGTPGGGSGGGDLGPTDQQVRGEQRVQAGARGDCDASTSRSPTKDLPAINTLLKQNGVAVGITLERRRVRPRQDPDGERVGKGRPRRTACTPGDVGCKRSTVVRSARRTSNGHPYETLTRSLSHAWPEGLDTAEVCHCLSRRPVVRTAQKRSLAIGHLEREQMDADRSCARKGRFAAASSGGAGSKAIPM